jgi:hypothetical protein
MATLRDLEEMLKRLPDGIKDTEFVVFDTHTGTRTTFTKGVSELVMVGSHGRAFVELRGAQDFMQRSTPPPFPGKPS